MRGPSGVLAMVLAETAAGGTALLWLGGLWRRVKRGFFVLTGSVMLGLSLLATLAAASGLRPVSGVTGEAAALLAAGTSIALGLSLSCLVLRLDAVGRALGVLAIVAAAATLVALAAASAPSFPVALLQLFAGAAFMGAVMDGLLLGHWYLVERRLPRDHIRRFALLLLGAVAVEVVAVAGGGFGAIELSRSFSPLLGVSGLATWLALGMVGATALIAVLIRSTLRDGGPRAVQAATGFLYLAVITAFAAEMAAKVRFIG